MGASRTCEKTFQGTHLTKLAGSKHRSARFEQRGGVPPANGLGSTPVHGNGRSTRSLNDDDDNNNKATPSSLLPAAQIGRHDIDDVGPDHGGKESRRSGKSGRKAVALDFWIEQSLISSFGLIECPSKMLPAACVHIVPMSERVVGCTEARNETNERSIDLALLKGSLEPPLTVHQYQSPQSPHGLALAHAPRPHAVIQGRTKPHLLHPERTPVEMEPPVSLIKTNVRRYWRD